MRMRTNLDCVEITVTAELHSGHDMQELAVKVSAARKDEGYVVQLTSASNVFFDWVCVVDEETYKELHLVTSYHEFARVLSSMLQNCNRDPDTFATMLVERDGALAFLVVNRIGDYRIVQLLELEFHRAAANDAEERARVQARFDDLNARLERATAALQEFMSMSSPRTSTPAVFGASPKTVSNGKKGLPLARRSSSSRNALIG